MQHPTLTRLTITAAFLAAIACIPTAVFAQTTLVPLSVTASVAPFNSNVGTIENLTLGITPATSASTAFPYAPGNQFVAGIGFVALYGTAMGTITYTFVDPVSISGMLVWNAYFDFELDHSIRDAQLIFRDEDNAVIVTYMLTMPQASTAITTGHAADLPAEVQGVKQVDIVINTLWGGNDISLRRIAFVSAGKNVGIGGYDLPEQVTAYPNPAVDRLTIPVEGITAVRMTDATGRVVPVQVDHFRDRVELHWSQLTPGVYHLLINAENGTMVSRVLVGDRP